MLDLCFLTVNLHFISGGNWEVGDESMSLTAVSKAQSSSLCWAAVP